MYYIMFVQASLIKVKALYDFIAEEQDELNFSAGDIIEVVDQPESFWWVGQLRGRTGLFPTNYITPLWVHTVRINCVAICVYLIYPWCLSWVLLLHRIQRFCVSCPAFQINSFIILDLLITAMFQRITQMTHTDSMTVLQLSFIPVVMPHLCWLTFERCTPIKHKE